MNASIEPYLPQLRELCRKHRVARLDLFGSATGDCFNPATSDFDFIVSFQTMTPSEHSDGFFGLLEDLEQVLGRKVDLLEDLPIENPYLRHSVQTSRVQLYAA